MTWNSSALPPQRELVRQVTAARAEIARQRAADQLTQSIAAEVEDLILGQRS